MASYDQPLGVNDAAPSFVVLDQPVEIAVGDSSGALVLSVDLATEMLLTFHDLVAKTDAPPPSTKLGDLQLLEGVRKFPQRNQ